jgi:hypothetical protein
MIHAGFRFVSNSNPKIRTTYGLEKKLLNFEIDRLVPIDVIDAMNKTETNISLPDDSRIYNGFIRESIIERNNKYTNELYSLIIRKDVTSSIYSFLDKKPKELDIDDNSLNVVYKPDSNHGNIMIPVYQQDNKGKRYGTYKNTFEKNLDGTWKVSSEFIEPNPIIEKHYYTPVTLSHERFYFYLVKLLLLVRIEDVISYLSYLKPDKNLIKKYLDMFVAKEKVRYETNKNDSILPFDRISCQYLLDTFSPGTLLVGNITKASYKDGTIVTQAKPYDDSQLTNNRKLITNRLDKKPSRKVSFPPIVYPTAIEYTKTTPNSNVDPQLIFVDMFSRVFSKNPEDGLYTKSGDFYNLAKSFKPPKTPLNLFNSITAGGINETRYHFLWFQTVDNIHDYSPWIELEFRWLFNDPSKYNKISKLIKYNFIFDLNFPDVITDKYPFFFESVDIKKKDKVDQHRFIDHITLGKYQYIEKML